jgi:hypothetical protein
VIWSGTGAFTVGYRDTPLAPDVLQKRCRAERSEETRFGRCGRSWLRQ